MTTRQHGAEKCRCCPYGFHIDVDFVAYAEDVRKGGQNRTPTLSRKHGDRLMSPLDSIFRYASRLLGKPHPLKVIHLASFFCCKHRKTFCFVALSKKNAEFGKM
ncbi:unnamed protein product [Strongylus vulgaris]|uniref:Uncharacterized protein n=1 Tax=Strongylus vulgaris TaxID=40348 RepID=A0A3P7JQY9_STRVU|nr:unnamed protein product [Strongylus vulgaris]